jgi:hypothetical protein
MLSVHVSSCSVRVLMVCVQLCGYCLATSLQEVMKKKKQKKMPAWSGQPRPGPVRACMFIVRMPQDSAAQAEDGQPASVQVEAAGAAPEAGHGSQAVEQRSAGRQGVCAGLHDGLGVCAFGGVEWHAHVLVQV